MAFDESAEPEMVGIDVEVTTSQRTEIDRVRRERGYPSRSEFVRDALRAPTTPTPTPGTLRELVDGLAAIEIGRTVRLDDALLELGDS